MNQNNGIWVGTEDLTRSEAFVQAAQNEFTLENIDQTDGKWETNRRDFLKLLGFGLGAATLASGCEIPIKKAVPYVTKPDDFRPRSGPSEQLVQPCGLQTAAGRYSRLGTPQPELPRARHEDV